MNFAKHKRFYALCAPAANQHSRRHFGIASGMDDEFSATFTAAGLARMPDIRVGGPFAEGGRLASYHLDGALVNGGPYRVVCAGTVELLEERCAEWLRVVDAEERR